LRRAYKNKPHMHTHVHTGATEHQHPHGHHSEHSHVHNGEGGTSITPWVLFAIFVFGPCEPLIPILIYPAAKMGFFGVLLVVIVFGTATIATMLVAVILASMGVNFLPLARMQRFAHVIAGATICLCGLAIQFLGL
jgi:nickel/cobalt exporter